MTQPDTEKRLPPDEEALLEMLTFLRQRRNEGWCIQRVEPHEVKHAGMDDPKGRFWWYEMYDPKNTEDEGKPRKGWFHVPPGTEV